MITAVKRQNVIFICMMKCKQTVYLQNNVEKNQNSNRLLYFFFLCITK